MTDNRVTQGGVLVGVESDGSPVRVTQGGIIAGYVIAPPVFVTQAGVLVGVLINPPERVTQAGIVAGFTALPSPVRVTQAGVMVGILAETPGCLTTEADLWKITRRDGTAYRFTSHDRAVIHLGETYQPCGSLTASALQLSATVGEVDNVDLSGLIYDNGIKVIDIWAGLFNGATVQVWRIDWTPTGTYAKQIVAGECGNVSFGDSTYKFEITTPSERLQQKAALDTVTPSCRYKLGDTRCGVNLAPLTVTGSVTALPAVDVRTGALRRIFNDSSRVEESQYWQYGKLTWTGGANTGQSIDIRSFGATQFVLEQVSQYDIQLGDTYSMTPGCDKQIDGGCTTFANTINFGGFPFVKGTDDLQRTPGQDID